MQKQEVISPPNELGHATEGALVTSSYRAWVLEEKHHDIVKLCLGQSILPRVVLRIHMSWGSLAFACQPRMDLLMHACIHSIRQQLPIALEGVSKHMKNIRIEINKALQFLQKMAV